ncbi:MAG: pyrroline-5-carboxylate reductase [Spirochaetes bacterium]|nr:pyrroline-5-carboxylate reductase [Spirochaetota bacterium]
MKKRIIGFIGGGNMAAALIGGLLKNKVSAEGILVSEPDAGRAEKVKKDFGVTCVSDNSTLAAKADVIVFAVKPQVIPTVAKELRGKMDDKLVISIIAGKKIAWLAGELNAARVVRVMPNTPAMAGQGMSALSYSDAVRDNDKTFARDMFTAVGRVMECDEKHLDTVTAVSGSGPAYAFAFIEAMADAAKEHGLSYDAAVMLAAQTFLGAAVMVQTSGLTPEQLRKNVTSPNGTTEAALKVYNERGVHEIIGAMIAAAKKRSEELSA